MTLSIPSPVSYSPGSLDACTSSGVDWVQFAQQQSQFYAGEILIIDSAASQHMHTYSISLAYHMCFADLFVYIIINTALDSDVSSSVAESSGDNVTALSRRRSSAGYVVQSMNRHYIANPLVISVLSFTLEILNFVIFFAATVNMKT